MSMMAIPNQTLEGFPNPSYGLLAPPPLLHAMPRSKTGRRPHRSSPLAGPAVSICEDEDAPNRLRVSSSPSMNRDHNTLSPPTSRPIVSHGLIRPKSMHSTLSSHAQSFSPPDKPIRPISAILSGYIPPLTRSTSEHHLPSTTKLRPPTILLNEESIEIPKIPIPPPARYTSHITETTVPRDNSWYVASAYEETPRFSRLGLGADVVLPVSAKRYKTFEHTRQQPSGNRGSRYSMSDKPATNGASRIRQSLLMGSLASTLRLTRSNDKTPPDHQSAQEPSPSSSRASSAFFPDSDSSLASSATSLSRTNSFTDSSSTYTFDTPDIVTSSSRTSIVEDEEMIQESPPTFVHGKDTIHQAEGIPWIARKVSSKTMKRRTIASSTLPLNLEKTGVISPAVNKDEKPRRGSTFKRFIRLFVLT